MAILIIAATEGELAALRREFPHCRFAVCGVGTVAAALGTVAAIGEYRPRLVINVGIAGAIDRNLEIGAAYVVASDTVADLGAIRDGVSFEKFSSPVYKGQSGGVRARTVSVACNPALPADNAQIETMEGAAFFAAAAQCGVRAVQIRAVSNYMDTARNEWRIGEAIAALSDAVGRFLSYEL